MGSAIIILITSLSIMVFFRLVFLQQQNIFIKILNQKKITYFNNFKPISQLSKNILLTLKRLNIKNKAIT